MIQTTQPSFRQEKMIILAKFLSAECPNWPLNAFSVVLQCTYCHNVAYSTLLDDPNQPTKFSARKNCDFGQVFGCRKPYMTLKCIQHCDTRYLLSKYCLWSIAGWSKTPNQVFGKRKLWFWPSFWLPNAPNDLWMHSALWYKVPTVIILLMEHCWMIQTTQQSFRQEKTMILAKFLAAKCLKWPIKAFSIVIQGTYCHNVA